MSILSDVKSAIGVQDNAFDNELIGHVGGVLGNLANLGTDALFVVEELDTNTEWPTELVALMNPFFSLFKALVFVKTRLVFDPPANSHVLSSLQSYVTETEFRLGVYISEETSEEEEL